MLLPIQILISTFPCKISHNSFQKDRMTDVLETWLFDSLNVTSIILHYVGSMLHFYFSLNKSQMKSFFYKLTFYLNETVMFVFELTAKSDN